VRRQVVRRLGEELTRAVAGVEREPPPRRRVEERVAPLPVPVDREGDEVGARRQVGAVEVDGYTCRRSRGFATSSNPTVIRNNAMKSVAITTIGGTHHHHQPLMIAALKFTQ